MTMAAEMRALMLQALREEGPMTVREIAEHLGRDVAKVNESMWRARKTHGTEFFRVVRYVRQQGHGGREAKVYDVGPGPDCRKPTLGAKARRETQYRYFEKNRAIIYTKKKVQRRKNVEPPCVFGSMIAVLRS